MNKIIERIEREAGVPGLAMILAERMAPTDLQSLLLEVYRLRSSRLQPSAVLADYETNRFVRPAAIAPTELGYWEQVAYAELPSEFRPVALAPVCPLGTSSAVSSVSQNWTVVTTRNTEVVSDSTNVLALECAARRRELLRSDPGSKDQVHLAASHRLLRAQHYQSADLLAHFSAFALCSAGRDTGQQRFELGALGLHIRFYLRALRTYLGPTVPVLLSVTDFRRTRLDWLESHVLTPIQSEFETVGCALDDQRIGGRGYYLDLCFHIHAVTTSGQAVELVDGGSVDWTQRLLSNAKERLVISGLGADRLCTVFGGSTAT